VGRNHVGGFYEGLYLVAGTLHWSRRKVDEKEKEGTAEKCNTEMCYRLIAIPVPHCPVLLGRRK